MMRAWSEPFRAVGDAVAFWACTPILSSAPRGDGHAVLVLPGFNSGDDSMVVLRKYLHYLGYRSQGWALGHNTGFAVLGEDHGLLRNRLGRIAQSSGGKVSLIGWSLGGVMARQMAKQNPELVRQVVTLGSPFNGDPRSTSIRALYEMISGECLDDPELLAKWRSYRVTPSVPTTSIYTRADGITAWQNCIETESATVENIEVAGSHIGLPYNPSAMFAVAHRLSQPEIGWTRHKPLPLGN